MPQVYGTTTPGGGVKVALKDPDGAVLRTYFDVADVAGDYSLGLEANADIDPSGTTYTLTFDDGTTIDGVVPDQFAPVAAATGLTAAAGGGGGGGGLLGVLEYQNAGAYEGFSRTGTTLGPFDAGKLALTFTVPNSGQVLVSLDGAGANSVVDFYASWGLTIAGVAQTGLSAVANTTPLLRRHASFLLTGLTAGEDVTVEWAGASANGNATLGVRDTDYGRLVMAAFAA